MERYEQLDRLLNHIWDQIKQGAADPAHPYHTPAFGSIGLSGPSLRTVILRNVDIQERSLSFHSDRRAEKIREIQRDPKITWLFWDPTPKEQLRLKGHATLHFEDERANQMWQDSHPKSLKLYVKPISPGTKVQEPQSGLSKHIQFDTLTDGDVEEGRQHFAVVHTTIDAIDFLHLHPEGNYRARFNWVEEEYRGIWVIP